MMITIPVLPFSLLMFSAFLLGTAVVLVFDVITESRNRRRTMRELGEQMKPETKEALTVLAQSCERLSATCAVLRWCGYGGFLMFRAERQENKAFKDLAERTALMNVSMEIEEVSGGKKEFLALMAEVGPDPDDIPDDMDCTWVKPVMYVNPVPEN